METSNLKLAGGIIVVLAVVLVAWLLVSPSHQAAQPGSGTVQFAASQTPVMLTDPPIVPTGTTALVITYSSVKVHTSGSSGSGWLNATGSGTINLMSLLNTTEVIGAANISANSTINMISFNVTSATITINGTTSNVTVPSRTVTAHITGESKVNATSGLLLDLSPTVAAIYTANSTVFVMVPSVRAIVVGNRNVSVQHSVGSRAALNASEKQDLEDAKANISIASSSLSVNGNSTVLSVTVKDNSNFSVLLRHILVFGNYSVVVASSTGANASVHVVEDNGSVSDRRNNTEGGANAHVNVTSRETSSTDNGGVNAHSNVTVNITASPNTSAVHADNANVPPAASNSSSDALGASESEFVSEGIHVQHTRMFNFLVSNSGALILPSLSSEFEGQNAGYNLTAGSTVTFTFSGNMSFGEGHITITPSVGSTYKLVVSGEHGSYATANVTAS